MARWRHTPIFKLKIQTPFQSSIAMGKLYALGVPGNQRVKDYRQISAYEGADLSTVAEQRPNSPRENLSRRVIEH
jgi:hypothetical protein